MKSTTAMARTLASRCFRNMVVTRLRPPGPPFRAGGAPKVSGLRSAVSLTSLIPILPFARGLCSGSYPDAAAIHRGSTPPRNPAGLLVPACHNRSDGDRAGVLDVLLLLRRALVPGRRRGVRIHVALDHELQAGVRGRRRHQAAGELEEVEVEGRQEALQVRR